VDNINSSRADIFIDTVDRSTLSALSSNSGLEIAEWSVVERETSHQKGAFFLDFVDAGARYYVFYTNQ